MRRKLRDKISHLLYIELFRRFYPHIGLLLCFVAVIFFPTYIMIHILREFLNRFGHCLGALALRRFLDSFLAIYFTLSFSGQTFPLVFFFITLLNSIKGARKIVIELSSQLFVGYRLNHRFVFLNDIFLVNPYIIFRKDIYWSQ